MNGVQVKRRAPARNRSAVAASTPKLPFDPDSSKTEVEYGDGWSIRTDEALAYDCIWVSKSRQVVCVNPEFWMTIHFDTDAYQRFIADTTGDAMADGMIFVPGRGVYRAAAIERAVATGSDVVRATDEITQLYEAAKALIAEAIALNNTEHLTCGQLEIFIQRHHAIENSLTELEDRMAKLRGMVSLAGGALMKL